MRALLVNHSKSETVLGGAERSLLTLGDAWVTAEPGLEIEVVTASGTGLLADSIRERGWSVFAVDFWPWALPSLYRAGENRVRNDTRDSRAVLEIAARIRETRPDVVVTNSIVNPWGAVAAALTGTPHVWFAREFGDLDHGLSFSIGAEQSFEDAGFFSDLVVANSEAVRDHVARFLPGREILVAYPEVALDALGPPGAPTSDPSSPLSLVMVGVVGPAKRQHLAIRALAGLRDRGVDARLTVVGPHDHPEYLRELETSARTLGVADRIVFEGYHEDPAPFVAAADVALMLSRSEAFGRVTLEYLAQGTPVVGIGVGGTRELIADGHSGFVVDEPADADGFDGRVDDLVEAIARYAADRDLLAAHAAAAPGDAAAIASRHPLAPVIEAIGEVARTAPRTPKLPHLAEYWLTLPEDAELWRREWTAERNPSLESTLAQFAASRRAPAAPAVAPGAVDAAAAPAPVVPPLTIVVPVYGDLDSLENCLRSVLDHGELDRNHLLVVNDLGPEADLLEERVLALIAGNPHARYERNPRNLGFGATCNRAVFELDDSGRDVLLLNSDARLTAGAVGEMQAVLNLAEKHGVVCPRTNNGTTASFPFVSRPHRGPEDIEHSLRKYAALVDELPRYTVSPVAIGFCFLVKRSVVDDYGLFDEVFNPGYSEENDYCLRINRFGYSAVFANHAYVIHEGSKSFEESSIDTQRLIDRNAAIVRERYPYFEKAIADYLKYEMDAIDWFADFLDGADPHKRVLIDLHQLTLRYDGTSRNALSFLALLAERNRSGDLDVEFVLSSSKEAVAFFDLGQYGFRTLWNESVEELFDLGLALVPITDENQIIKLNRLCARWVNTHLDVIGARILTILENDIARREVLRDAFRFADRTVVISEATIHDTIALFPDLPADARARMTVVHQGAPSAPVLRAGQGVSAVSERYARAVSTPGYVLVVGNVFAHKQLPAATAALRGQGRTVVVFGSDDLDDGGDVVPVPGGSLSDRQVAELYEGAGLVVFPSCYEGFGLPVAEAARHGKRVVLFDTEVAHEVVTGLGLEESADFFSHFDELASIVAGAASKAADGQAPVPGTVRTLDAYNADLLDVVLAELERSVDLDRLRARMAHFRAVSVYRARTEEYLAEAAHHIDRTSKRKALVVIDNVAARVRAARGTLGAAVGVVKGLPGRLRPGRD
ncbi:glycosyltransferase [Herbiconiux solani]|uniref:glycosyltransferase n=1 Tax=Herbiconiux solani TaxID=661329 RepID=UPI000823FC16|nr:glycosyltransferase [Herbiconiux solani]